MPTAPKKPSPAFATRSRSSRNSPRRAGPSPWRSYPQYAKATQTRSAIVRRSHVSWRGWRAGSPARALPSAPRRSGRISRSTSRTRSTATGPCSSGMGAFACASWPNGRVGRAWRPHRASAAERRKGGLVRVGVVSPHFRNHSVWNAIVKGWFQKLDPTRFALEAFHLGFDHDGETAFARSHAAHFEEGARGLYQWAQAIVDRRPDVLVYPEIGMFPMTVRLASLRLAPVQVTTWGHPETSGLATIDYYLSAQDMEPADGQAHYTERLVTLPHLGCSYQPTQIAPADPGLAELDSASDAPVFVCPGVPFKYAPQHDQVLPGIARALGRCRFVFFRHGSGELSNKLRRRLELAFARDGLDFGDFGVFVPWLDRPSFYGLLQRADVLLDTIGFSGFNTAMQAVESALPIVTVEGRFLRGRLASGILKRMRLQELVASSPEEYVAVATRLARDGEYRKSIRGRIEAGRHILFDDDAPIRAMETFLAEARPAT
ncbi:MAG: hypothetical protein E6H61_08905 [Betaproteobacteria bacterium]|nr:MAG: hypothetical protein E6H61_08905 [Betaproteobacteria bacterium]